MAPGGLYAARNWKSVALHVAATSAALIDSSNQRTALLARAVNEDPQYPMARLAVGERPQHPGLDQRRLARPGRPQQQRQPLLLGQVAQHLAHRVLPPQPPVGAHLPQHLDWSDVGDALPPLVCAGPGALGQHANDQSSHLVPHRSPAETGGEVVGRDQLQVRAQAVRAGQQVERGLRGPGDRLQAPCKVLAASWTVSPRGPGLLGAIKCGRRLDQDRAAVIQRNPRQSCHTASSADGPARLLQASRRSARAPGHPHRPRQPRTLAWSMCVTPRPCLLSAPGN